MVNALAPRAAVAGSQPLPRGVDLSTVQWRMESFGAFIHGNDSRTSSLPTSPVPRRLVDGAVELDYYPTLLPFLTCPIGSSLINF
jgi:hypothetical protein